MSGAGGYEKILFATRGKVFTPKTLARLVECTGLNVLIERSRDCSRTTEVHYSIHLPPTSLSRLVAGDGERVFGAERRGADGPVRAKQEIQPFPFLPPSSFLLPPFSFLLSPPATTR